MDVRRGLDLVVEHRRHAAAHVVAGELVHEPGALRGHLEGDHRVALLERVGVVDSRLFPRRLLKVILVSDQREGGFDKYVHYKGILYVELGSPFLGSENFEIDVAA